MHRDQKGFSLTEVLIAMVILGILTLGALQSMKTPVGFTTRTGRFTESVARSLQWSEGNRNAVAPTYTVVPPPQTAITDNVALLNVSGQRTLTEAPFSTSGGAVSQLKQVTVGVNWTEPK